MRTFFIFVLLAFSVSAFGQKAPTDGLKVNGLGLGAAYKTVVAKFGKPVKEKIQKGDECVPDRRKILTYPGLTFELIENDNKNFTVISFEVTSAKYDVSGVRIGDTQLAVSRRFGKRSMEDTVSGQKTWLYEMTPELPGNSNFFFRAGKITKIQSGYEMC